MKIVWCAKEGCREHWHMESAESKRHFPAFTDAVLVRVPSTCEEIGGEGKEDSFMWQTMCKEHAAQVSTETQSLSIGPA